MTSFLSALRAEIPAPSSMTSISNNAHSLCESLQTTTSLTGIVPTHFRRAFRDPFLSSRDDAIPSLSNPRSELLKRLQIDHDALRTANEHEAAVTAAGAVVTSKRHNQVDRKPSNDDVVHKLIALCSAHTRANSATCFLTAWELAESIVQTIQDSQNALERLQAQVFSLVGVEGMDLIAFAVQNHLALSQRNVTKQKLEKAFKRQDRNARESIKTETEKEEGNWLEAAGYDPAVLRVQQEIASEAKRYESTSLIQREFGSIQGGYDSSAAAGQLMAGGALTLPSSTQRTHYKGYEHVVIPAPAKKALKSNETLVAIASLDAFAQTAFQGLTWLNRLQSTLFHAAYYSNQNLLVCAPTGAGKTNVAMLTVLQEIKTQRGRQLDKATSTSKVIRSTPSVGKMKIIYVAPMKALAQEIVTKFGQRLHALGLQVRELTGDMQLTKKEIEATHVIVTTPEKWDVITRKSSTQQSLLSQVKLLIIDEVHLLADERGPVIETIVARTLRRVESTQSMIRIVGLSATLPNYVDVASFLRVYVPVGTPQQQNAATNGGKGGLFYFDATYRPVPLDQTFIGVSTNASLKEALGLSTAAISTVITDKGDCMKDKKKTASAAMSRQRQVQMMMNKLTLAHCLKQVQQKEQVMVFVHSRKETAATMHAIMDLARANEEEPGLLEAFLPPLELQLPLPLQDRVQKSRNKELKELLGYGLGIHHAGMLRSDRNLTEQLFELGYIRVLCCTATLAWGVNLPAHSVLIKGTQVCNANKGGMTQLSMLDVMQIFGRAGRPQYDTSGDAVLITTQDQLAHYLRLLTTGIPMESALIKALPDHLNAEIVSGTVTNLDEACTWLSYTYLYVRMRKNPLAYGMKLDDVHADPMLVTRRRELLLAAAEKLASCRMIKIIRDSGPVPSAQKNGNIAFVVTAMGRVASHFYIQHTSIETFNELLDRKSGSIDEEEDTLTWDKALLVLCSSHEFEQLQSREEEMPELEKLKHRCCRIDILGGGMDTYTGKTNILLQSLISRARVSSFTLISDTNYVAQNGSRVCRALFELCLKKNSARKAEKFLQLANCIDQRMWFDQNALLQFPMVPLETIGELERSGSMTLYDAVADPDAYTLSLKCRKWVQNVPFIDFDTIRTQPFGSHMLKLTFNMYPLFHEWKEAMFQGKTLTSWLWIEDAVSGFIYHFEYFVLHQHRFLAWKAKTQTLEMECYLPVFLSSPQTEVQYILRILSDRFVGIESFYHITYTPPLEQTTTEERFTKRLQLHPQPLTSLENATYESLYPFISFNPIQTQTFHELYHTDDNVLLGAPSGSGKTVCAELAMLRLWTQLEGANTRGVSFHELPVRRALIVYIAPKVALARKMGTKWKQQFGRKSFVRKNIVEVTDETVVKIDDMIEKADIIVTTPVKWDEVTRMKAIGRTVMAHMALVIIDEVHLVSEAPHGAVLEVLLSRLRRFQSAHRSMRIIALATTLANASDVGRWLGAITTSDLDSGHVYNFRASERPVPVQVIIQGFPERQYVARMAAMNKPTYMAIQAHSIDKPVVIFVSSKAQTKLTALDLIQFCVASNERDESKRFLRMDEAVMSTLIQSTQIKDETLKHTLAFGIGLFHAGLTRREREVVEKLYTDQLIQVIIATSSTAWGWTLPTHLVVIKGTEYFDNGQYRSYPLSDLLHMIGRAGQFHVDDTCVACVFVEEGTKNRMQRFLEEPYAVESCLASQELTNHVNAEIAAERIGSMKECLEYLTWTLFFQRVMSNPRVYDTEEGSPRTLKSCKDDVRGTFLYRLIQSTMDALVSHQCVVLKPSQCFEPTFAGKVAATLYVDVRTVSKLLTAFQTCTSTESFQSNTLLLLCILCESSEELESVPLRHYEVMNHIVLDLCAIVNYSPIEHLYVKNGKRCKALLETHGSQVKAMLVLQLHLMGKRLPSSDFVTDLRMVLDHVPQLVQAAIRICAHLQLTSLVRAGIGLARAIAQASWPEEDTNGLKQLPHVAMAVETELRLEWHVSSLMAMQALVGEKTTKKKLMDWFRTRHGWTHFQIQELVRRVESIPRLEVKVMVHQSDVKVVLTTLNDQGTQMVAVTSRFQKPQPYGYYVLLTIDEGDKEELVQLAHVAWQPTMLVTLSRVESGVKYNVHVLSDTIAGIDTLHVIRG
ncbi:uncharacterized protein CCR75_009651 [Bremia lactucae]|uniref:Activating signal cointegrator 1 complex subunit 3 n=1 Tax=Bremia lactucae TaxID=4779 RepID=A0A976FG67_BRELC|nr:hypothetical protein CCR75_009651 [Bremia lactucae]